MPADPFQTQIAIARRMAEVAQEAARRFITSRTVSRALSIQLDFSRRPEAVITHLVVPHYWAVYYHDGRGPVKPILGKYIVWFKSIEDDPRVAGGRSYPVRTGEIKRLSLTKAAFRRMVREGKLIVTKRAKPFRGVKFFDRMAKGMPTRTARIALPIFRQFVTGWLRDAGVLRVTKTIRLF